MVHNNYNLRAFRSWQVVSLV